MQTPSKKVNLFVQILTDTNLFIMYQSKNNPLQSLHTANQSFIIINLNAVPLSKF